MRAGTRGAFVHFILLVGRGGIAIAQGASDAAAQDPGMSTPTVGDTVWIERAVNVPAGISVRPRPIAASELLDPLAAPHVVLRESDQVIRYPVVFWRAGSHTVDIPGPILVRPDGWSDTLRSAVARVEVASLLPEQPRDSIPPRPPEAAVTLADRSVIPVAVLLLLGALVLLPVYLWWRRRGPAPEPAAGVAARPTPETLDAWLHAGEIRAALEGWSQLLRARKAESSEGDALLAELAAARYGPLDPALAGQLAERARRWLADGRG